MKTHELFSTIDRGMTLFFKWICIVAFVAIAALITANIFLRRSEERRVGKEC
jgi:TRAP-type C4-dicarboxylate transport system permease small subunit